MLGKVILNENRKVMASFNTLPTPRKTRLVSSKSEHLITDVSCGGGGVRARATLQAADVRGVVTSSTLGRRPKRWKSLVNFHRLLPLKKSNSSAALR